MGTATLAPGAKAQGGWASHWVKVDVDWPAVRGHGILEVVLQFSRVLHTNRKHVSQT